MICSRCGKAQRDDSLLDANGICFPCNDYKDWMKDASASMPKVIQDETHKREFQKSLGERSALKA